MSATSELVKRLITCELREGRGFERTSVLEMHKCAISVVERLVEIIVDLDDQLERQRASTLLARRPLDQPNPPDPQLSRAMSQLSERDRERAFDYLRLLLLSDAMRGRAPS